MGAEFHYGFSLPITRHFLGLAFLWTALFERSAEFIDQRMILREWPWRFLRISQCEVEAGLHPQGEIGLFEVFANMFRRAPGEVGQADYKVNATKVRVGTNETHGIETNVYKPVGV